MNKTNEKISEKVRELINSHGIDTASLAAKIKCDANRFLNYYYGKARWDMEYVEKTADFFRVSIDYLTGRTDELNSGNTVMCADVKKIRQVPVFGEVYCGYPAPAWDKDAVRKYLALPEMEKYKEAFGLIAKGLSMTPYINPEDILICADIPEKIKDGKAVVVVYKGTFDDGDINAKLVQFNKRESKVTFYSVNTKFPPQTVDEESIYKLYKVIKIIRDVK
ncbi:MAG: hypothetical protein NTV87_12140 [Ignavibacteriae bacterium]|nr:hypothetical protein [Ignavibacteriota bacterium]